MHFGPAQHSTTVTRNTPCLAWATPTNVATKDTQRLQNGMPMCHTLQGGQKDGSAEFRRAFRKVLYSTYTL